MVEIKVTNQIETILLEGIKKQNKEKRSDRDFQELKEKILTALLTKNKKETATENQKNMPLYTQHMRNEDLHSVLK